jgi:EAL domain-containing protein (putative c-di-GMP-specific phosphodiesterase class I)
MDQVTCHVAPTPYASPAPTLAQARRRARLRLAARERRRDTRLLADALDHGRLRLERAPRWRLADLTLAAEEVTLQWPHSLLPAPAALTASGFSDVGRQVGQWMLAQTCALAAACPDGPLLSLPLPGALLAESVLPDVTAALAGFRLPADRLELRLSEVGLLEPTTEQLLSLSGLRDRGVRLALEHFGMRHGCLALLRQLPLNAVHLDPGLTHELSPGGEDSGVVAGVVALAHALGLTVAARTMNGLDRLAELRRLGVDEALGSGLAETAED